MPGPRATRATLLSGFLGAGKTTLLNRLLRAEHGERTAVLINDFGDVCIDASLVVHAEATTIELSNGCVCCTIQGDLLTAVQRVLQREPRPERLVLELSGVADPRSVVESFLLMRRRWPIELDGVIVVVDAEGFMTLSREHRRLALEQLDAADLLVLNKVELASPGAVEALRAELRRLRPGARLVEASYAEVPLELLLGSGLVRQATAPLAWGARAAPHAFDAYTWRGARPLALARLRAAMVELPPGVVRAKGVVWLADVPDAKVELSVVGTRGRVDRLGAWGAEPPGSVVVFCGSRGELDPRVLDTTLTACEASARSPRSALGEWLRRRRQG